MISQGDRFQYWLIDMDNAIDRFLELLPKHIKGQLDYSLESLSVLEAWLIDCYPSVDKIKPKSEMYVLDGASRYVGELFRRYLGGKWFIDYSDQKNAFYGLPQLHGMTGQTTQFCPMSLVTASLDRRTGRYIFTILENKLKKAQRE